MEVSGWEETWWQEEDRWETCRQRMSNGRFEVHALDGEGVVRRSICGIRSTAPSALWTSDVPAPLP